MRYQYLTLGVIQKTNSSIARSQAKSEEKQGPHLRPTDAAREPNLEKHMLQLSATSAKQKNQNRLTRSTAEGITFEQVYKAGSKPVPR